MKAKPIGESPQFDDVLKRMLSTPPQPKTAAAKKKAKTAKQAKK